MLLRRHESPRHAIAILGNGLIQENGKVELPDHVRKRLDYAANLYTASRDKPLIAVLGKWSFWYRKGEAPPTTEADEMQRYLLKKGLPQQAILPERLSEDTAGNAERFKKILTDTHIRKATILCADYHAERASFIFRALLGDSFSLKFIPTEGPFTGSELERQKRIQRSLLVEQMPLLERLLSSPYLQENLYEDPYYTNQLLGKVNEAGKSALGVTSGIER